MQQVTDAYLRSLKVSDQIQKIHINCMLELWIWPTGKKVWYLFCNDVNGTRQIFKIGKYPYLSLEAAIHKADALQSHAKNSGLRVTQLLKGKHKIGIKAEKCITQNAKQTVTTSQKMLADFCNKYDTIYSLLTKRSFKKFDIMEAYNVARRILRLFSLRNNLATDAKSSRNADERTAIFTNIKRYDLKNNILLDFVSTVKNDRRYLELVGKIPSSQINSERNKQAIIQKYQQHTSNTSNLHSKYNVPQASRETSIQSPDVFTIELKQVFAFSGALTHAKDFKLPDSWVSCGKSLDYLSDNQNGRTLMIRLGIDFGTAYTKVAYHIADKVHFVQWVGIRKTASPDSFFLPGEMSITSNDAVVLGRHPEQSNILNNLKKPFLDDSPGRSSDFAPIIIFVAWIFRYARAWIYRNHEATISKRKLAYQINFGKPSSKSSWQYDKEYKRIIYSAWILSQYNDENISIQNAEMIFRKNIDQIEGLDLELVPEFAAQITGYTQSPQRENDLHMFFDIGAGTIDVSLFNLTPFPIEGERFFVLTSDVKPFGTHFLMQQRIKNTNEKTIWTDHHSSMSHEDFARHFSLSLQEIIECDASFVKNVQQVLYYNLHYTREKRYRISPKWQDGVRTFVAGGGSRCALYTLALQNAFDKMQVKRIPMNASCFDREIGLGHEYSQRLSVAYGLTFDAGVIGTIIPPDNIPDTKPEIVPTVQSSPRDLVDELYSEP